MANTIDLGMVTAYAYAVAGGYTGTEQEFEELLGTIASGHGSIAGIEKTGTSGNVDTFTITYTDGTTSTFTVTNGEITVEVLTETLEGYVAKTEVDANLDSTSELPVQNKVVTDAIDRLTKLALNQIKVYGVRWDRLTNQLTRCYDSESITMQTANFGHFGSINTSYNNPFDSLYPWSEFKVCNVDLTAFRNRGTNYDLKDYITAYYGDADFTYIGTATNFVGRYRPEYWYTSFEDENGVTYLIATGEIEGFWYSPPTIDAVGLSISDNNNGITSGSGLSLSGSGYSGSAMHTMAKNSDMQLMDIYTLDSVITAYLVEFANMNSQSALGSGCVNLYRQNAADTISAVATANGKTSLTVANTGTFIQVGGEVVFGTTSGAETYKGIIESVNGSSITLDRELAITDGMYISYHGMASCEFGYLSASVGNASGYIGVNGYSNAYYRGAMIWGNKYIYTLGIYRQTGTGRLWLCDRDLVDNYDALNISLHTDTGTALPELATAGWQQVGGNASIINGLASFLATGTSSGSSVSPVGDQQYVPLPSAGNTVLWFGGYANRGANAGAFCGNWDSSAGISNWYYGSLPILK